MRVLQICFRMPYPLKDGGAIAMFNLTKGLFDQNVQTTLLIPITEKHNIDIHELPDEITGFGKFHSVKIKSKPTLLGALINLFFSKKPYYISRYIDKGFENKLIRILSEQEFDYVIFESLKVSMYVDIVRKYSKAGLILRSHNVEYKIWDRLREQSNFIKKHYLKNLVKRIEKYELNVLEQFDCIATITGVDRDTYLENGLKKPVFNLASGIDLEKYQPDRSDTEKDSLFHIGSLDWAPNQEAVRWFAEEIWPRLKKEYPNLKFYLAGRNMPEWMHKYRDMEIEVVGEVEDALEFIHSKEIMIVPLLSGSGLRIKVMEGLALGKIIISTTVGAEGIEYTADKNIFIADTPDDFFEKIRFLQKNESIKPEISHYARELIENKYDNRVLIRNFLKWLKDLSIP